ncbi:dUTP diphosphatase [Entomospira culicis]|uniref:Deoxyuridine 5'-triphosphate nucleotidohydrolase n=1 Tax=Entomospira culicis TaxID=2719989 RepID=A0A968GFN8_9SPIO|nr:dUTP diphosphatase [Entomospira culicis]NIZ18948.1 dUTP diphosphatase [Entomospira culicis]NIZ69163.1 dUTP diphosphatase [Entomospira culicis]WDI37750.1 dUTP diphosphatase [Entomospira culicis]WDI39378.1 dUTP diphosphatase [Entomospira culicis]
MTSHPTIVVHYLGSLDGAPRYASALASGADLQANISEAWILKPQERKLIPTGISLDIPAGYEAQVRSRSGLALHHGVVVLNSPGTIDADYRGEIGVILYNTSEHPFTIEVGMRIAQLVFAPIVVGTFVRLDGLDATVRASSGFGASGLG